MRCNNSNNNANSQLNKPQTLNETPEINEFKEKSIEPPASSIEKLQNRTPVKVDENLIFGVWEDQNSMVTYKKDYKFFGSFDKYRLKQQELGTFEIKGDTMHMHFTSMKHDPAYIITAISKNEFTIESLDDGAIFYKKRVK